MKYRPIYEIPPRITPSDRAVLLEPGMVSIHRKNLAEHGLYWYHVSGCIQRVAVWLFGGEFQIWFLEPRVFVPISKCPPGASFRRAADDFWEER